MSSTHGLHWAEGSDLRERYLLQHDKQPVALVQHTDDPELGPWTGAWWNRQANDYEDIHNLPSMQEAMDTILALYVLNM